jgi:hypothetical protein
MSQQVIVTSDATPLGSLPMGPLSGATGVQAAVGLRGAGGIARGILLARTRFIA